MLQIESRWPPNIEHTPLSFLSGIIRMMSNKEIISLPDNLSIPFYPESFGKQSCHHDCTGRSNNSSSQKSNMLHGRKKNPKPERMQNLFL